MSLSAEQRAKYTPIIDGLLKASNLEEVSAKRIRNSLQGAIGEDLSPFKTELTTLIHERFDIVQSANEEAKGPPTTNGASPPAKSESPAVANGVSSASLSSPDEEPEERPKKKQKTNKGDSDAALAARLQAELNGRSRPTRNGTTRKKPAPVKKSPKKKKSATKVTEDDDSAEGSGSEKTKRKPGGAFNAPHQLSEPLAALLGKQQLSRPQTVKRIWAHIKENKLQHEDDKRQIRCDDAMRAVFNQDNIHMFSMNKTLSKHLYPLPEAEVNGDA